MAKRQPKIEWESSYGNYWHKMYWRFRQENAIMRDTIDMWQHQRPCWRESKWVPPLICGNINGHVGEKANGFHGVYGGFGYGSQNEDGVRILEFAESHKLFLLNTYFKKRAEHLITYKSGMSCTQIDFILVRQQHRRLFRKIEKFI
ncbi:hypothetical protein HELRODRAFT_162885 [Helobdella robusta]|uniref:Endonuclease/exonuclease/phosphatase domain-containing protein n=1 Tax=Helobdella robusta TaxID=6412 RepID=T1ETB5_HELRO|nr:hypothetical protein HELRODRAFT_162885 [Helobdella robusta]ESN99352.1 hypothetical protein HELRODRAFT_162885 [Helobdella robusta]